MPTNDQIELAHNIVAELFNAADQAMPEMWADGRVVFDPSEAILKQLADVAASVANWRMKAAQSSVQRAIQFRAKPSIVRDALAQSAVSESNAEVFRACAEECSRILNEAGVEHTPLDARIRSAEATKAEQEAASRAVAEAAKRFGIAS